MTADYATRDLGAGRANPQRLRATLRAWIGLIIVGTILGAVVGFGVAYVTPPTYTASTTLIVTPTPTAEGITNDDLQFAQAVTPTYAELATTGPVLRRVIASSGVAIDQKELAESVTTHVPAGTSLLTISVSQPKAADAAKLSNAIAAELIAFAPPGDAAESSPLRVDLTVVDPAIPPTVPDGPGIVVRTALGAAIGLFMTLSFVFLIENIWPADRSGRRQGTDAVADPGASSAVPRPGSATWPTDPGRASTIGTDPLASASSASQARIASRGVVNELEIERARAVE